MGEDTTHAGPNGDQHLDGYCELILSSGTRYSVSFHLFYKVNDLDGRFERY